jgi:hypothetical protein
MISRSLFSWPKNLIITKNWFDIMVKNKWLEQPPLAPNRKELAQDK